MAVRVLVVLAPGFEEIEALTPVDYLRRAGFEVVVAGVGGSEAEVGGSEAEVGGSEAEVGGPEVVGSHRIAVQTDHSTAGLSATGRAWDGFAAIVLPGGMPGARNLAADSHTVAAVRAIHAAGGVVAAICAAPAVVLAPLGLLGGRAYTCFPGFEAEAAAAAGAAVAGAAGAGAAVGTAATPAATAGRKLPPTAGHCDHRVVVDGRLITARAAGVAGEFAIEIIRALTDDATAERIAASVQVVAGDVCRVTTGAGFE